MAYQLLNVEHTGNPRLDLMLCVWCGMVCVVLCGRVCVCGEGERVCVVWEDVGM